MPSSTPGPRTASASPTLYAHRNPPPEVVAEIVTILERAGAEAYTRTQARLHRDRALEALDAAGVVLPEARARLEEIIVRVIAA